MPDPAGRELLTLTARVARLEQQIAELSALLHILQRTTHPAGR